MSLEDRPVSGGPARDDPELGDTFGGRAGREPDASPSGSRAGDVAASGRERAGEVASSAGEQARGVATTAEGEARQVARSTGDQARRLTGDARQELRTQAESQMERLADGLDDLTRQLRSMGERGDPGPATDLAQEAADRTQRVARTLRQDGLDYTMGQLRDFGRNRPGLFLLGTFGLGLVTGRVVRNVAQEPNGDGSAGQHGGWAASDAAGQGEPAGRAGERGAPSDAHAVPAPSHVAYGAPTAPVSDERWGG